MLVLAAGGLSNQLFKFLTEPYFITNQSRLVTILENKFDNLPLLKYLEDHGVTLKDLLDTALEMHIPHPGVETREKAAELFKAGFYEALTDQNVAVLEVACFRAEEDGQAGLNSASSSRTIQGAPRTDSRRILGNGNSRLYCGSQRHLRVHKVRSG